MPRFSSLLLGLLFPALGLSVGRAADEMTTPMGSVGVTVAAGSGGGRALTAVSVPLDRPSEAQGQTVGQISSLTSNTISNADAGWTPGELSSATAPTLLRITSGTATGRTFLVSSSTANTETTLTIDAGDLGPTDLTTLGIEAGATGDTYELLQAHTLATLFGVDAGNGILAGTDPKLCDQVRLMVGGAYRSYYLNNSTNPQQWRWVGPNIPSDHVVIKLDTGVNFSRLANTDLELSFRGDVPIRQRIVKVADGGSTTLSVGWAAGTTLAELDLSDQPSWTSGSPSIADSVRFLVGGAYRTYYHDGTHWRWLGPNIVSDNITIPAGTVYVIKKQGTATSSSPLTQAPPYDL